jgi:hypothetical protein
MSDSFTIRLGLQDYVEPIIRGGRVAERREGPMTASEGPDLTALVNVGRSVAGYFERIGITRIAQLVDQDPIELYERMSAASCERLDPCLLDTVMSAVDQAEGRPGRPWWHYTAQRKRLQVQRDR